MYAAWRLQHAYAVTLLEADDRLGGHAHTVEVEPGVSLDTAFIIFNTHTYPRFYAWLDALGVRDRVIDAEMSMTFFDRTRDFYFAGRAGLGGLFAQPKNALSPFFWRLLGQMRRFKAEAYADFQSGAVADWSLADYVRERGYSDDFANHFLLPMAAAVWSLPNAALGSMSAATLLRFLGHHALLKAQGARWQTMRGGSGAYVDAFRRQFSGTVQTSARVTRIVRDADRITVDIANHPSGTASLECDDVVLATNADISLALLAAPTPDEARLLGAWRYTTSRTVLHDDPSLLPPRRSAWSAWNITTRGTNRIVSYDLVRIQQPNTRRPWLVSLGAEALLDTIPAARVARTFHYRHPVIDAASRASQPALASLNGIQRTWFAGSYFGDGFHEDALASAEAVADALTAKRPA